jgi:uncharacterized protein YfaP (DUF2135 family)
MQSLRRPGGCRAAVLAAAALVLAGTSRGQPLPNLTPYQPPGWSDRIVVSKTAGSKVDSGPLIPTDTLYVTWAVLNNGTAATGARFFSELSVDGVLKQSWFSDPPLNPNFYGYVEDYAIGSLPVGTHTIRIKTDTTNAIAESAENDNEYTKTIAVSASTACAAGPATLCLNNSRFKVQVAWRVPSQGTSGAGNAVGLTADTGYFWFFSAGNIELVVKVVDGRSFNGKFWVFYGALTNVEYTITVTDTATGVVKTYFNPFGQLASVADTAAFAGGTNATEEREWSKVEGLRSKVEDTGSVSGPTPDIRASTINLGFRAAEAREAACVANATTLCLNGGRFKAQVAWSVPAQGTSGPGMAVPLTGDTGHFWFFSSNNIELVLKVVDGRSFNDAFWVFFGALSNVQYTITVTDTLTGTVKTYTNASGQLASVADTAAFLIVASPAGPLIEGLQPVAAQARMNHENSPALIRGAAAVYNPEIAQLIAAGASAVPRILDEFRRPVTLLDETPLSLLAYALEKIGDASAVPVLTDWLDANLFAELQWTTDIVTHTIKVLNKQNGLNTTNFIYSVEEKLDTIVQSRAGSLAASRPLSAGTCSATASDPFGTCPQQILVTGINAAGQQETFPLEYRVAKRDLQEVIDTETNPTVKASLIAKQSGWLSGDNDNYGGTAYVPVPGAKVSVQSNCAGTVIEHIINQLAIQKGFPVALALGGSSADQIRELALKFGGEVSLSSIDPLTVVSHEATENGKIVSKHVEVPVSAGPFSAEIYSKDNYGILRQHTANFFTPGNPFDAAQKAYGNRPWYQGGDSPITTRFYKVDPSRILGITVGSSHCPCNPSAPDAIAVVIASPSTPTTDKRVITVSGTVGSTDVKTATLTVNNLPQSIAVASGVFSSEIVLRSGDNSIKVDVTGPTGRRGCAQAAIKSTTPKTTISVTLTWSLPDSDVDLYVTQPDGETSWYGHQTTAIGGRLDVDNFEGFGPENYYLSALQGNTVLPGVYTVRVHYYKDRAKTEENPTTRVVGWRVVVLLNEGTSEEKTRIFGGTLGKDNAANDSPGSSGPDWAFVYQITIPSPPPP